MPQPPLEYRLAHSDAIPLAQGVPDRVTTGVRVRPVGLEPLRSLVNSGDLSESVVDAMPIFEVASVEWLAGNGSGCIREVAVAR